METKSNIQVNSWYGSFELNKQFGEFICDFCKKRFSHSPSEMFQDVGKKNILFFCICGLCTNRIMEGMNLEKPYK